MGNFWLKLWVWIKVTLFALLSIYILLFVIFNQGNRADVWAYPGRTFGTTVLVATLFAFLAGVIGTILVRTTLTTLRQVRALSDRQRQEKIQRDLELMHAKAAMLRPKPPIDDPILPT